MTTTQFRLRRQAENAVDGPDAIDDFRTIRRDVREGSETTVRFNDADGTRSNDYPRGQRTEIEYSTDGGSTWTELDQASVARPNDTSDVALIHQLDCFDYGWYLRKSTTDRAENDTISNILETVVKNDTPLTWNAANVTVDNDVTISREWAAAQTIDAVEELSRRSNGEDYGVNSDFEFFFESRATGTATAITDTDWIDYNLPDTGRRARNKVIGKYRDGEVTSIDQSDQDSLESELGAARDVELTDVITLPDVADEAAAQNITDQWRERNTPSTRGWIDVPLGRFDTDPGDDIDVTIDEKNLSAKTFTVAAIDHWWNRAITRIHVGKVNQYQADIISQEQRTSRRSANALTGGGTGGGTFPHVISTGETAVIPEGDTAYSYAPTELRGTLINRGRHRIE